MAQIDALLRMLVSHGGDALRIEEGKAPLFTASGTALRMTFPPISATLHEHLLAGVNTGDSSAEGAIYDAAGIGTFSVSESGGVTLFRVHHDEPASSVERGAPASPAPTYPSAHPNPPAPPEPPGSSALPASAALLEPLLARALSRGASDLHIDADGQVVARVDGKLRALHETIDVAALEHAWLDDAQRATLQHHGSVDLAREVAGSRLRVNVYRYDQGTALAIRVLRRAVPSIDRLGLPPELLALADLTHGLVVVCGPTGAGKSTTLAALAQAVLQRRGGVLLSLEDPIEYSLQAPSGSLVRQRQIGTHVRDFASGLRDALREDPDIIVVGEMRDPESISLAITAAETGHLVLASLHARSASASIERMIDAYPPERQAQIRVQLASAFEASIYQSLETRVSGRGRLPLVEILRGTYGVRALIRDGRTGQLESAMTTGRAEGMLTRDQHARALQEAGLL